MCPALRCLLLVAVALPNVVGGGTLDADSVFQIDRQRGDAQLARYFTYQVADIEHACLSDIDSADDWITKRPIYRRQLLDMLGLDPLPARTPLNATVTGLAERDEIVVERLHFQSSPGLYVTGNLYRPAMVTERLPAILYVCGHGPVVKNGISYGNKVYYQRHGAWFARHGYVCLLIDTIQLGEIQGVHHGTYRHDRWWWNARGYTPAGVEAWNCHRALDYLISRDDVDPSRIGVTGRSGGGAYSWWLAATDKRVAVAVPVAGVTSLWNQVVDGCVEGHCDCMFHVNTYRWDFPQITSLVAPRPLLISNSDKDTIFPLEGVIDTHRKTRHVYRLLGADANLGLQITEGPHSDTQELRIHAFRWMNRFLKDDDSLIAIPAESMFEPEELRVFTVLPDDEIVTTIDETFVPIAKFNVPDDEASWEQQTHDWLEQLQEKCFAGWPTQSQLSHLEPIHDYGVTGGRWLVYSVASEHLVELPLYVWLPAGASLDTRSLDSVSSDGSGSVAIQVLDDQDWAPFVELVKSAPPDDVGKVQAWFAPRGIGPTAWTDDPRERTHIRRRYMLIGQTLDGMRVWDVRRSIQTIREIFGDQGDPIAIDLAANGTMAGVALYASLFEANMGQLDLQQLPSSHRNGPIFLNVLRVMDLPQAVALAATKSKVHLRDCARVDGESVDINGAEINGVEIKPVDINADWEFPQQTARQLQWPQDRFVIE